MSQNELQNIKDEFSRLGLHPTYFEHEPVITSEDAAKTRGFELRQGIKSLLFTDGKDNWVIVDVPAHKKAHQKKVAEARGWTKKDIRMATPEEVLLITGCEVGSVPPFGHKTAIPIFVDRGVFENKESAFNVGLRTHSVKIATEEMRTLFKEIKATEGDFTKQELKSLTF
ncbi:MAG: YbaK/EbsC family protein [Candidatus Paceibacterota bacterium]